MLSKNKLTQKAKYDIIAKMNKYKWNQLTVENVGSFMFFRGKSYGQKKENQAFDHADYIAQLSRDDSGGQCVVGITAKFRRWQSSAVS